jgi:fibrillarin-like rRNA methylase
MFTGHHHLSFSCSHELEKNVVKKKIRTMKKADTESKIAMKKDAIQSSDESIQLYEDEQKTLQEKLQKMNDKQQDLAMK